MTLRFPIAAMVCGASLVAGCTSYNWGDPKLGQDLAARIRAAGSPLVREVGYRPETMIDPSEVHVIVQPGVTEEQAVELWCDVVAPAGGSQFEGSLGALIDDDAGTWLAANATCDSP